MSVGTLESAAVLGFLSMGPMEMVILGVIAVLLFGKRLPEVGRSLGKGLVEFKRSRLPSSSSAKAGREGPRWVSPRSNGARLTPSRFSPWGRPASSSTVGDAAGLTGRAPRR